MTLAIYFGDHNIWILWLIFEIPAAFCSFKFGETLMEKDIR